MFQYARVTLTLLQSLSVLSVTATHSVRCAFHSNQPIGPYSDRNLLKTGSDSCRFSAIPYDDRHSSMSSSATGEQQQGMQLIDNMIQKDNEEEMASILAKKEQRRVARVKQQELRKPKYLVTLPLVTAVPSLNYGKDESSKIEQGLAALVARGQEYAVQNTIGMSLRQVYSGRKLSELALDVDTLRFISFVDELQGRRLINDEDSNDGGSAVGSVELLQNSELELIKDTFDGVLVSSVTLGGFAWEAGVRAGDVLTATSATVGKKLWPKSTLDGVRSAISSRKAISSSMEFEFSRPKLKDETECLDDIISFTLSLSRPIGINVEDTDDGYVTVTGISNKASSQVKDNLRVGDRVVSVESSIGGKMWEVYNVDGLTSAVTCRLPGQLVRVGFERVKHLEEANDKKINYSNNGSVSITLPRDILSDAVDGFRIANQLIPASAISSQSQTQERNVMSKASQKMLLSRSRDLLKTYISRKDVTKERALPSKVADRVLEAVIEASATLDGPTLSLLLKAYNTCDNAEKSIELFEEVFGLAGDGSERKAKQRHGGKLFTDINALNVITISTLLSAHAIRGDHESAVLVLAAMEGRDDFSINGRKALSWSGKGDPLNMLPDTRCYNIALAAAAKCGTIEGIQAALEIFDSMPDPSLNNSPFGKPAKNLITYNTMIDIFASVGKYQDAFDIFTKLKKTGLSPDRVTYTTLIKASINSGNIQGALDIFDDMKWVGIHPDIVSYNRIIEALCNSNRLFEAKDLVNDMENTRVKPDSMTYGLLMKGLLKANKPGPCLTLFESAFIDRSTTALTENVQIYTTAITAAAALGDHERALELVTRMNSAGVKPNKKTLTALIGACISGEKYDAAVDIFYKIKNPDGYAISMGLKALCNARKFDSALRIIHDERNAQKNLTGKQVMSAYNHLIKKALESQELNVARDAFSGLLSAGYIPSKATFESILDGLNLQTKSATRLSTLIISRRTQVAEGTFKFLLFILDSLGKRKLTVDSIFYTAILSLGAQDGSLHKRIAFLMSECRRNSHFKRTSMSNENLTAGVQTITWEELLLNYSTYKEELGSKFQLPLIRVPSRDLSHVLAAEQAVTYQGRRQ